VNSNTNDRRHTSGVRWRYAAAGLIVVCLALYVGSVSVFRSSIGESQQRPCENGCASPSPLPQLTKSACDVSVSDGIQNTERLGQFQFPPSAANIVADCFGMQGWGLRATFDMAADELTIFLAATRIEADQWLTTLPATEGNESNSLPSVQILEASNKLTSFLYGTYSGSGFRQEILIDTSDSTMLYVQISAMGG